MKSRIFSARVLAGFGIACAVAITSPVILGSSPAYADEKPATLSPEASKPVMAAKAALDAKNYAEALDRLKEADAVKKTPFDQSIIDQFRLIASLNLSDVATAAKAYDSLDASSSLTPDQKLKFSLAIAQIAYKAKDYPSAITFSDQYFKAGGTELSMRSMPAFSYHELKDDPNTIKASNEAIDAYDKAGQKPPETLLLLVASSANKLGDKETYIAMLERLIVTYPKPEYWPDLIHRVGTKPGVSGKFDLDLYRLLDAVGGIKGNQYLEYADAANQAGFPGEAKNILEKGSKAGVIGSSADYPRLRDSVQRSVATDQPSIAKAETEAGKQPNGNALVSTGMDYFGYGQNDKALSLIQAGIAKGGLKNPEDAKLNLGIVQLAAGNKTDAVATFKSITSEPASSVARLWILKIDAPASE